jgi:pSer/pThr/pTyr-binding forkhead associated (FHA) protein
METIEASLHLERGPQPDLRFILQKEQATIGRSAGNDLVLADPEVSRRHARLVRQAGYYAIEDMGSTNGTFVNGQRIGRLTALQDGDIIDLGDTIRLRYQTGGDTGPLRPAPAVMTQPVQPPVAPVAEPLPPVQPAPAPLAGPPPPPKQSYRPYVPAAESRPQPSAQAIPSYDYAPKRKRRGFWLGCGVIAAALLVCAGTFLLLDAYDNGRLLYCGSLRPLFELLLGPFGFAPLC